MVTTPTGDDDASRSSHSQLARQLDAAPWMRSGPSRGSFTAPPTAEGDEEDGGV